MSAAETITGPQLDERVMPAGTNARFALVVVLALVTTAKMVLEFTYAVTAQRSVRCELAAGVDVYQPASDASVLLSRLTQAAALTHCEARYAPPPSWWLPAGWPVLVLIVAVLAFYADRWWKTRRPRTQRLAELKHQVPGFDLVAEVRQLAEDTDLDPDTITYLVDNDRSTCSATVLGSSRKPVLSLHFGLVSRRLERKAAGKDDPDFRAVLLHEFAHIYYGDVTAARGAMAVWRAFFIVALLPYMAISIILAAHGSVVRGLQGNGLLNERDLAATLVLACIGYLARLDVMRNREIYADREAVRNDADRKCWPESTDGARSRTARYARAFAELWRNHPSDDLRARSVDDSAGGSLALFTVQALPVFLTGVAAAIIDADFQYAVQAYGQDSTWIGSQWMWQATGTLSAALVTLIVGVALWRFVAYERPGGKNIAVTVLRSGLWLGAGMIVGDLATGQGTIDQVIPGRPEMYLLVLAAGAGFCWWTTQCAGAWLTWWRDRVPRRAMTACLAGGFLLLCWWFTWWADAGAPYSTGISFSASGYRSLLKLQYPGPVTHPAILAVISWFELVPSQLQLPPADLLAVGAAWVIPLLAWTRSSADSTADGLPSLRAPLAWAVAGTVATWACVIGVQAYLHQTQPPRPQLHGMYELTYMWFVAGVQVVPATIVALAVAARHGRFRLLVTLIAAEATVLAGVAGTFLLVSADGCVLPLDTLETYCSWRPGLFPWGYATLIDTVAVIIAIVAFTACAIAFVIDLAVRREESESADRDGSGHRFRALLLPVIATAAALGIALAGIVMKFPQQSHYVSASNQVSAQNGFDLLLPQGSLASPPANVAALEIYDWNDLGGATLLSRFQDDREKVSSLLEADTRQRSYTLSGFGELKPWYADIAAVSRLGDGYFHIPDGQGQSLWSDFITAAGSGGRGCEAALALLPRDHFSSAFWDALDSCSRQIGNAYTDSEQLQALIKTVEGGHQPPSPPLALLAIPAGAQRSPTTYTGNPMNLQTFVQKSFPQSDWGGEKASYSYFGFLAAAREGWYYANGSGDLITVVRYSGALGATTLFDDEIASFRSEYASASRLTDPADGGAGVIVPGRGNQDVTTTMVAHVGGYALEVQAFTPTSDPAVAEGLLREEYGLIERTGGAQRG